MKLWLISLGFALLLSFSSCSPASSPDHETAASPQASPSQTANPGDFSSATPSIFYSSTPSQTSTRRTLSPGKSSTPALPGSPTPTLTSIPTPLACWQEGGRIETGSLPTDLLPEPLDFRIYLPPCYDQQPERRYASLYLIHGQSSTDDQWDRLGADETADALIAAGEAPPFFIIMPRDRRWSQPDEDHFGQAVVEVLIPWIDQQYRTHPEREYRAVGGLSRGAGWAVNLALSHWEMFSALGTHSLPVFWTDTYSIKEWLNAIPAGKMPRIYMDNPNNDRPEIMQSSQWFEKLLTQRGIPHEWHLFKGYHEEKYWQAHVEQYLRWYAEGWKE